MLNSIYSTASTLKSGLSSSFNYIGGVVKTVAEAIRTSPKYVAEKGKKLGNFMAQKAQRLNFEVPFLTLPREMSERAWRDVGDDGVKVTQLPKYAAIQVLKAVNTLLFRHLGNWKLWHPALVAGMVWGLARVKNPVINFVRAVLKILSQAPAALRSIFNAIKKAPFPMQVLAGLIATVIAATGLLAVLKIGKFLYNKVAGYAQNPPVVELTEEQAEWQAMPGVNGAQVETQPKTRVNSSGPFRVDLGANDAQNAGSSVPRLGNRYEANDVETSDQEEEVSKQHVMGSVPAYGWVNPGAGSNEADQQNVEVGGSYSRPAPNPFNGFANNGSTYNGSTDNSVPPRTVLLNGHPVNSHAHDGAQRF